MRVQFLIPTLLTILVQEANSHGRLMNPPARNCMWRFGFPNPVNYNDNELFCGGYTQHQFYNKGKCGVCGDAYNLAVPRPHETGGMYGNGVIARRYYVGQEIAIRVDLTSNHLGYFQFRICPATNNFADVTQECLDKNILKILNPDGSTSTKYKITNDNKSGVFNIKVRLPSDMVCDKCVIQWTYTTGNTWGTCEDGTQHMGCGPQETFINCADVSIHPYNFKTLWMDPKLTSSSRANPHMMYFKDFSKEDAPLTPLIITYQLCIATKPYEIIPGIDEWCQATCMRYPPYCPSEICRCVQDCDAVGEFSKMRGADQWCLDQCSVYPPKNCTAERCQCL